MVYELLHHAVEISVTARISFLVFTKERGENLSIICECFNKTIILLALVGYEMIIANSALPFVG